MTQEGKLQFEAILTMHQARWVWDTREKIGENDGIIPVTASGKWPCTRCHSLILLGTCFLCLHCVCRQSCHLQMCDAGQAQSQGPETHRNPDTDGRYSAVYLVISLVSCPDTLENLKPLAPENIQPSLARRTFFLAGAETSLEDYARVDI